MELDLDPSKFAPQPQAPEPEKPMATGRLGSIANWVRRTDNQLLLLAIAVLVTFLFNVVFLYRVANQINKLTRDLSIIPESFAEILGSLKGDLDGTLKPLNENLKVIKESMAVANMQEFQTTMVSKLEIISAEATNIKNLAGKDTLQNLTNKIDGMQDTIDNNLKNMDKRLGKDDIKPAFEKLAASITTRMQKLEDRVDALNKTTSQLKIDELQNSVYRKLDNISSHLTKEVREHKGSAGKGVSPQELKDIKTQLDKIAQKLGLPEKK